MTTEPVANDTTERPDIPPPPPRCCYGPRDAAVTRCAMCGGPICAHHGGDQIPPICALIDVCITFVKHEVTP